MPSTPHRVYCDLDQVDAVDMSAGELAEKLLQGGKPVLIKNGINWTALSTWQDKPTCVAPSTPHQPRS